jgi:hypothetical protein
MAHTTLSEPGKLLGMRLYASKTVTKTIFLICTKFLIINIVGYEVGHQNIKITMIGHVSLNNLCDER